MPLRDLSRSQRPGKSSALIEIAGLLDVAPPARVTLIFYRDEETKKQDTGHAGLGWAEGNTIIEVLNDDTQLDPFHELVHVVGAALGHPPALWDEGFAVYASERLGADALGPSGQPGISVRTAGCNLVRTNQALPLAQLFDFTELGSRETRGPISHPQSGSFVQYLIETYGLPRFRKRVSITSEFHGCRSAGRQP